MDHAIAERNLFDLIDIVERRGARVFLIFGTLLGAVRERGFIAHDEDMDAGVMEAERAAFLAAVPDLQAAGFSLVRVRDDRTFEFVREGVSLDIFLVRPTRRPLAGRRWDLDGRTTVDYAHLERLERLEFLGRELWVPSGLEALMRRLYGKTWRTPIKDRPAYFDFGERVKRYCIRRAKRLVGARGRA